METMPLTHGRNARAKPGNGTTLAMRQGSPRRSERYRLSISCCILSRWPLATLQALSVSSGTYGAQSSVPPSSPSLLIHTLVRAIAIIWQIEY